MIHFATILCTQRCPQTENLKTWHVSQHGAFILAYFFIMGFHISPHPLVLNIRTAHCVSPLMYLASHTTGFQLVSQHLPTHSQSVLDPFTPGMIIHYIPESRKLSTGPDWNRVRWCNSWFSTQWPVITRSIKPVHQEIQITHMAQTLILVWVICTGHWTQENTFSVTLDLCFVWKGHTWITK